MNAVRHINLLKSAFSCLTGNVAGRSSVYGMPPFVSIELTSCCNLECPECPSGAGKLTRQKGFISTALFERVIQELRPYLFNLNLYFQGEPMLHPDLLSILERSRGIHTVLSTNGHFLSEGNAGMLVSSGLGKLTVSLDGLDQEIYSAYRRNGDVQKVMDGIRNIAEARRKSGSGMEFEIQFLVNRLNEHQIPEIKRYAREMNASLKLKSMQVINYDAITKWLPSIPGYARYLNRSGTWQRKGSFGNSCVRLWLNPVITWDGQVVPCCFDKNAEHIMGDLNKNTFSQIWRGELYKNFRREVLSCRRNIGICRNCTSGLGRVSS